MADSGSLGHAGRERVALVARRTSIDRAPSGVRVTLFRGRNVARGEMSGRAYVVSGASMLRQSPR